MSGQNINKELKKKSHSEHWEPFCSNRFYMWRYRTQYSSDNRRQESTGRKQPGFMYNQQTSANPIKRTTQYNGYFNIVYSFILIHVKNNHQLNCWASQVCPVECSAPLDLRIQDLSTVEVVYWNSEKESWNSVEASANTNEMCPSFGCMKWSNHPYTICSNPQASGHNGLGHVCVACVNLMRMWWLSLISYVLVLWRVSMVGLSEVLKCLLNACRLCAGVSGMDSSGISL